MNRETAEDLLAAFNRGWTGKDDQSALELLRTAWAAASTEAREVFKAEIMTPPPSPK